MKQLLNGRIVFGDLRDFNQEAERRLGKDDENDRDETEENDQGEEGDEDDNCDENGDDENDDTDSDENNDSDDHDDDDDMAMPREMVRMTNVRRFDYFSYSPSEVLGR